MNFSHHEPTLSRGAEIHGFQEEIEHARAMSGTFEVLNQDLQATLQKLKQMHDILDETEERIDTWLSIVDKASFYQQLQRAPTQPTTPSGTQIFAQNQPAGGRVSVARDSTSVRLPPKETDNIPTTEQHGGGALPSQQQTQKAVKSVRSTGVSAPKAKPSAREKAK